MRAPPFSVPLHVRTPAAGPEIVCPDTLAVPAWAAGAAPSSAAHTTATPSQVLDSSPHLPAWGRIGIVRTAYER